MSTTSFSTKRHISSTTADAAHCFNRRSAGDRRRKPLHGAATCGDCSRVWSRRVQPQRESSPRDRRSIQRRPSERSTIVRLSSLIISPILESVSWRCTAADARGRLLRGRPRNGLQPVDNVRNALNETSAPWRLGITWLARQNFMVYANVSKGYKAGAAAVLAGRPPRSSSPCHEESLLAYEAGIKAGMLDRRLQLNASVFHYHYRDKQLRGSELDPVFGPLEALVQSRNLTSMARTCNWLLDRSRG